MAACWIEITMTNGTNGSFTQKCYGKEQWPALLHISPKKYACAVQLPSNHKDIMFYLVNVNCLTALCVYVFCIHNACIYCIHTISQCPLPHSSYCWSDGRSLSQLCRWLPTVFCMFSMCFCKSPLGAWFPLTIWSQVKRRWLYIQISRRFDYARYFLACQQVVTFVGIESWIYKPLSKLSKYVLLLLIHWLQNLAQKLLPLYRKYQAMALLDPAPSTEKPRKSNQEYTEFKECECWQLLL